MAMAKPGELLLLLMSLAPLSSKHPHQLPPNTPNNLPLCCSTKAPASPIPLAVLPVAAAAAYCTSLYHGAVWAPVALLTLCVIAVGSLVDHWMSSNNTSSSSSDGSSAASPEQVLQLIQSRRSIFPRDFNGARQTEITHAISVTLCFICWVGAVW